MSARKKEFLNTVRILLLGAPLFLTACHSDFGPYPMPTGYKYHNEVHKTPPGPEPVFKKIEKKFEKEEEQHCPELATQCIAPTPEMMMAPAAAPGAYDHAAADLVRRVIDQFGRVAEPVYVEPAGSAAEAGLEQALRAALADQGFTLAQEPGMGPYVLNYAVTGGLGDSGRSMISVRLTGQDGVVTEQSGLYDLGDGGLPMTSDMPPPHVHTPAVSEGAPLPIGPE